MSRTRHRTRRDPPTGRRRAPTRLTPKKPGEWYFPFINNNTNNGNQRRGGKTSFGGPLSKVRKQHAQDKVLGRRLERRRRKHYETE